MTYHIDPFYTFGKRLFYNMILSKNKLHFSYSTKKEHRFAVMFAVFICRDQLHIVNLEISK